MDGATRLEDGLVVRGTHTALVKEKEIMIIFKELELEFDKKIWKLRQVLITNTVTKNKMCYSNDSIFRI